MANLVDKTEYDSDSSGEFVLGGVAGLQFEDDEEKADDNDTSKSSDESFVVVEGSQLFFGVLSHIELAVLYTDVEKLPPISVESSSASMSIKYAKQIINGNYLALLESTPLDFTTSDIHFPIKATIEDKLRAHLTPPQKNSSNKQYCHRFLDALLVAVASFDVYLQSNYR